jgi:hypothetical protein
MIPAWTEKGCRDGLIVFPKVMRLEYAEDGMLRMVCGSSIVRVSGDEGGKSARIGKFNSNGSSF